MPIDSTQGTSKRTALSDSIPSYAKLKQPPPTSSSITVVCNAVIDLVLTTNLILTALTVIRIAASLIDAQIIAVYVVITSTALSRVQTTSTQFVGTILLTTTTLKPVQFCLTYVYTRTATVIRPAATDCAACDPNNLETTFNRDLIDTTTNGLTAQENIHEWNLTSVAPITSWIQLVAACRCTSYSIVELALCNTRWHAIQVSVLKAIASATSFFRMLIWVMGTVGNSPLHNLFVIIWRLRACAMIIILMI